jgi:hypothetical protein
VPYVGEAYRYGRHLQEEKLPGWYNNLFRNNPYQLLTDTVLGGPQDYLNNQALAEGTKIDTSKGILKGVVMPSLEASGNPIRSVAEAARIVTPLSSDSVHRTAANTGLGSLKRWWNRGSEDKMILSNLQHTRATQQQNLEAARAGGDTAGVEQWTNGLAQNAREIQAHGGKID